MEQAEVAVPAEVARWLDARDEPWQVVADASWPRSSSRVWRVEVGGADAYLKINPTEESFRRERSALEEMLPRTSIRTQRLIDADSTSLVLLTTAVTGDVVRTLDPAPPAETEQTIHAEAGAALRAVHGLVELDDAQAERVRSARAAGLLARAHRDLEVCRGLLSDEQAATVELAERSFTDAARSCPLAYVHGDFQPRNWLWDPAVGPTALIDFEEATVGYVVEDLAWLFATTWSRRRDLAAAFLRGYGRDLTPQEQVFLAAATVLGSLRHIADGERLGIPKKIDDGFGALRVASGFLAGLVATTGGGTQA